MSLGASQSFDQQVLNVMMQVLIKILRSSHRRCSVKKAQLCLQPRFNKVAGLVKKKRFQHRCSYKFRKIHSKTHVSESLF